ncbi:MAG TPA: electron-transfer flavoprotein:ubiquinone oxidoreductase [Candidatus Polarisedimenticolaceae bacterium]|nr:electron-transfer flavoprotein:ubiquinone oxidoreductase [Candidatus Polarisedimenticolaceae bacterium]
MAAGFVPRNFQPDLPLDRLILNDQAPSPEAVEMDVVFVGGGPAGLAGAIEIARLAQAAGKDLNVAVLEKAESLGEHCLSGAVVNPRGFRELFPDLKDEDFPFRGPVTKESVYLLTQSKALAFPVIPPTMNNHGNFIASICEIVRWLGEKAEGLGVNLFTGFPAASLLTEGKKVIGVRTTPSGLDRQGNAGPGAQEATDVTARVVALAEGSRGSLSQAWTKWQGIGSQNPQIFALGVKEIWETKVPLDRVIHTMGWPLPSDAFGGTFAYPLEPNVVALGLVVGLDYHGAAFDVHEALQRTKLHPLFRQYLEGGDLAEWGAKTIPEGGFYAIPERRTGDGCLVLGDAAGFVEVASLKGIHYAVQSGIFAARAIWDALQKDDVSGAALSGYDRAVDGSYLRADLYERRNLRLAFKHGFYGGGARAALMTLTKGAFPRGKITVPADVEVPRVPGSTGSPVPLDGKLTIRKLDAVFKSGNKTRDTIPSHLIPKEQVPPEVADFYAHLCPAGVYESTPEGLKVNPPNCIDCKATDVLGPRWTPREGGAGPRYRRM